MGAVGVAFLKLHGWSKRTILKAEDGRVMMNM